MKISIIGSGAIGQATGIGFSIKGNNVVFYDTDKKKLFTLKEKGFTVSNDLLPAIVNSQVVFLCVPTPTIQNKMDLSYIEDAAIAVAKSIAKIKEYKVIVVRSTVLPSTTRCKIVPLLERHSGLKSGLDFGICMNPEFLREKTALEDFIKPSRIVIGEIDRRSGDMLALLYSNFFAPLIRTDLDNAEMAKYVSNIFLSNKISFFNEIFLICKKLGLDSNVVSKIAALDPRIGDYGVNGGRPYEGSCLPKDTLAFLSFIKENKLKFNLLEEIISINDSFCSRS